MLSRPFLDPKTARSIDQHQRAEQQSGERDENDQDWRRRTHGCGDSSLINYQRPVAAMHPAHVVWTPRNDRDCNEGLSGPYIRACGGGWASGLAPWRRLMARIYKKFAANPPAAAKPPAPALPRDDKRTFDMRPKPSDDRRRDPRDRPVPHIDPIQMDPLDPDPGE